MIKYMMWTFLLFTVLMIPAIYIYNKNDGLQGLSNYSKARFTVGNFGFSADNCRTHYLGMNKTQNFSCSEGFISVLSNFGLIPEEATQKDYCGST